MTEVTQKLGVDPGFGFIKIALVRDGQIVTNSLPSVVGVGETDDGALNRAIRAGGVRGERRGGVPFRVEFGGVSYLVGEGVERYAKPIERMDFQRFGDSPELRATLYATLWQMLDGGSHQVALALALPVEVLQDKAGAEQVERAMQTWLVGQHRFSIDGALAEFEVLAIRAQIAQPVATWFDWGLNEQGQWTRGNDAVKAPCLVIDQGFNTLDLIAVEGGRISTRYTGGDTLGMRRAAEMAISNIERKYGVGMSLHEADRMIREVLSGKRASTYVVGQLADVTNEVNQAINAVGAEVVRFVERQIGNGKRFRILITGGGGAALAPRLLSSWAHAELMADPALANARGLAKLAQRPGFLG